MVAVVVVVGRIVALVVIAKLPSKYARLKVPSPRSVHVHFPGNMQPQHDS